MIGIEDKIPKKVLMSIIALVALNFMGVLSETSLNIAYSSLMEQFQVSASTVQWLTTGYLLVLSITIPISPFFVKKFPTKRLFQSAVLAFFAGTLVGALAPNFPVLLLGRLIMAVGTGIALPLATNIILEQAPVRQRSFLLGIIVMVTTFAPAVGPIFGGFVMEYLTWHWLFLLMFPVILFSMIAGSLTVTDIRKGEKPTLDPLSVLLSVLALAGIVVGFSISGDWGWNYQTLLVLLVGVVCLLFFVHRQLRLNEPLIQVRIFKYPAFTTGILMLMIGQINVLAFGFLLPIFLQNGIGRTSLSAALILLPGAVLNAVMNISVGALLKKYSAKTFLFSGFLIQSVMLFIFLRSNLSIGAVVLFYLAFMLGAAMINVPAQTNSLNQLSDQNNADGSAIMNTLQQTAGAIGTALASSFLTSGVNLALSNGATGEQAYVDGLHGSLVFFLILTLFGVVLALITRKGRAGQTEQMEKISKLV